MARIQFGQSTCQIEGTVVPVADVSLDGGESVYFMHHTLLFRDDGVSIDTVKLRGGWSRAFAGMPLVMVQASGKGHIAFSHDAAGEIVALPIQVGSGVEVREHTMLIASGTTAYDWVMSGIFFSTQKGDDQETHFPMGQFLDRFTAPRAPGLVLALVAVVGEPLPLAALHRPGSGGGGVRFRSRRGSRFGPARQLTRHQPAVVRDQLTAQH